MAHLPTIEALGTHFWIEIWDDITQTTLDKAHTRVQGLLDTFETNYSRFKQDSLLSQLNREHCVHYPTPEFRSLLEKGLNFYDLTEGNCNMMVGETLVAHGYDASYSFTPTTRPHTIPNPHDVLSITPESITLERGLIDLGGYGKGIVIDLIVELLCLEFELKYFLINGGGDIYGTSEYGAPITLYLEHPTIPQTYIGTLDILNQGFAASSPHKRAWIHNQITYTHIIDSSVHPSELAQKIDASFIVADTAVTADVFATTALIATPKMMTKFATTHQLGVATFALPTTFIYNPAFHLQTLPEHV